MAGKRKHIPRYGTVQIKGNTYYRTSITELEGNRISLYAKTREELYDKEMDALEQIDNAAFRKKSRFPPRIGGFPPDTTGDLRLNWGKMCRIPG